MEVYLLRHGSAEPGVAGVSDAERPLTAEGRQEIQRVVSAAKLARACPSLVLSSPYKRAIEAAQIAADLLDYKGQVLTSAALTPDSSVEALWNELRGRRDEGCVVLAGHEPLFSSYAAYLLGSPELRVDFPPAGMARIDVDGWGPAPRGVLKWMLTPQLTI